MERVSGTRKVICLAVMALSVVAVSSASGEWQLSIEKYGLRIAGVSAPGSAKGQPVDTVLRLICRTGPQGTVSLEYTVLRSDLIPFFGFDDFEGPGAPASSQELMEVEVSGPGGTVMEKGAAAGSYGNDSAFTFSMHAMNSETGGVAAIARAIAGGASTITVTVRDMKNRASAIRTEFPATKAAEAVGGAVRGCCR
ncbi:MAG: hypothetical protein JXA20_01040 [Spirochaetes bacterium]|nr:hypothetical protein [Spirochaetota bacterium]